MTTITGTGITGTGIDTATDWQARAHAVGADFASTAAEQDRRGEICTAAFDRLRADGLTAALVPAELGGGGATHGGPGATSTVSENWFCRSNAPFRPTTWM